MEAPRPAVAVLFNQPRPEAPCIESDAGVLAEVAAVAAALEGLGHPHRTVGVAGLGDLPAALAGPEPVIFNLVESLLGPEGDDSLLLPALARALGKACTGNDTPCLALCLDKWLAKAALQAAGVPTPPAVVVPPGREAEAGRLPAGPLIVKPLRADASEGIDAASLATGPGLALARAVARVHREHRCPALVESFIAGRELNVALLADAAGPRVLPLAEIDFSAFPPGKPRIVDYAAKWHEESFEYRHTPRRIPAPLPEEVAEEVRRQALAAWQATGCRDYCRVDFRLDRELRPWVLEVNPNPDIAPDAGFAAALAAGGVAYGDFVAEVVAAAHRRLQAPPPPAAADPPAPAAVEIRRSEAADRDAILALVAGTGFFRPAEVEVAREVLDEALAEGPAGDYHSYTALVEGRPAGWVCFGATACTVHTYDIYWLAVDRKLQGRGLGRSLMARAEALIAARGGRLAVVETSGRIDYASTRSFYERVGYREAARLPGFYAPGDDKVVLLKTL